MNICVSCKNKNSDERCTSKPIKGLILCGKHARVKNPRIWSTVNNVDSKVIKIQKLWRGYTIRQWLKLAGPCVLNRSNCHNQEELVTFDDKKEVYPLDYFAFKESDKVYWFDIKSIIQNSFDKLKPINPYTREPLTIETRQRLRKIAILRDHRKLPNLHSDDTMKTPERALNLVWTTVCQIIEENGFPEISPMYFIAMNKTQLYVFINMIHRDVIAWASEHTTQQSRRKRYIGWFKYLIKEFSTLKPTGLSSYMVAKCLISFLNDYPDPYEICFIIMSALHRV